MRTIIGVMGSGRPLDGAALHVAHDLGARIAAEGWVLLTGGRAAGVMDAASQGARENGGLVVGVLPDEDATNASPHLDIAILTGMGDARNVVNVLSSDVVIALPGGAGTVSEVALALNAGRTVIALGWDPGAALRGSADNRLLDASDIDEAIGLVKRALRTSGKMKREP
ncbi:MAG: TIGR00725 family protein [Coriobacteriia bacterium]|nr:TIGR00725 family protein [Coriobacteriia bacterium]